MKSNLKFIHCSDIHLGANPYGIEERFEDMGKAFMQVVKCAIDEKVDFVVIAGDFFHQKSLNAKTLEQAVDLLEPLKNADIPVYMTEGNHDMATYTNDYSWLDFLCSKSYVYLLKPCEDCSGKNILKHIENNEGSFIETDDYIIVGLGYPGATASIMLDRLAEHIPESKTKPVITMLHTGIDKFLTEGMGGVREEEIAKIVEKSDYIALGHIHTRYDNSSMKYYNPGSIENVKIESLSKNKEKQDKGFYLVNISKGSTDVEFKKVTVRNSINTEICIDEINNNEEELNELVMTNLKDRVNNLEEEIIINIKLTGSFKNGSTIIDLLSLKKYVKANTNAIYVEILNNVQLRNNSNINFKNAQTREDIDKEVILNLIKNEESNENNAKELLNIIMYIKDIAKDSNITSESVVGEDIKGLIEKYLENKK